MGTSFSFKPMTKAGNDLVRRVLVECANVVMKSGAKDTDLKLKGLRIGARGGRSARRGGKHFYVQMAPIGTA